MATLNEVKARAAARRGLPPPAVRKAIREAAGLSLRELAEAMSPLGEARVDASCLWRWECGQREPGVRDRHKRFAERYAEMLRKLAAEFVT
jgi:transcriptional regulator with XRE-family HTH domain